MKTVNNIKALIEHVVKEVLNESSGKKPTKEQINATFDLLKSVIKHTHWSGKVYVAGGAVRDMVMGADPKDIDLVVEMEDGGIKFATYVAQRLGIYRSSNPIIFPTFGTAKITFDGVEHNGVKLDGIDVEVVNTREESYTPGSRKPTTKHGSIKSDVMRRDLTINSLLMDLMSGEIVDLTGKGREDIKQGIIRTPSDPDIIFTDDPLRLMRAVRFAGRYNYTIPDYMKDSIRKNSSNLSSISRERVKEELEKILTGANPELGVKHLYNLDLMPYIAPSVANTPSSSIAGASKGKDFIEKLALMLNPANMSEAMRDLKNLKLSNEELNSVVKIIESLHLIKASSSNASMLKAGTNLVNSGLGAYINVLQNYNKALYDKNKAYFNNGPVVHFQPSEIINMFRLKPGPVIGKLVAYQKNLWYENPEITREEVLEKIKKEFKL